MTRAHTKRLKHNDAYSEAEMMSRRVPEVPSHVDLPEEARPAWNAIARARDFASWTAVDLEHAVNLACCLSDMERLRRELRVEGDVVENARGTQIVNPKHSLLETLSRRSVALSRMLQVHAQATVGDSGDQKQRNTKQRALLSTKDEIAEDDLIAPPVH